RGASERVSPDLLDLVDGLQRARAALDEGAPLGRLDAAVAEVAAVNGALRGAVGVRALIASPEPTARLQELVVELDTRVARLEEDLDAGRLAVEEADAEPANRALVALKDAVWAVERDRLPTARAVAALAGPDAGPAALDAYFSIQV